MLSPQKTFLASGLAAKFNDMVKSSEVESAVRLALLELMSQYPLGYLPVEIRASYFSELVGARKFIDTFLTLGASEPLPPAPAEELGRPPKEFLESKEPLTD